MTATYLSINQAVLFSSDSHDTSHMLKFLPQLCPRADGAKRRARVLIPPGYLHPGKRKH